MKLLTYGIIATMCLATLGVALAQAKPQCFFLECESGQQQQPPPSPVPTGPPPAPTHETPFAPQPASLPRPSVAGESCKWHGGAKYCASSVLKPQIDNSGRIATYGPELLVDGLLDTAWVEGKSGNGEGEWVLVDFGSPRLIYALEIYNGYHKNVSLFRRNARVRGLEITLSNGHSQIATLADRAGPQTISVQGGDNAEWVQAKIRSVYQGSRYDDTAISELRVLNSQN